MLLAAVFVTSWLGFALLALSQDRHWRKVTGFSTPPGRRRVIIFRIAASLLLAASLALALLRDGPGFGSLLWATAVSIAALAVAFMVA